MMIDQGEIDNLLDGLDDLSAAARPKGAPPPSGAPLSGGAAPAMSSAPPAPSLLDKIPPTSSVARLLRIRVPLVVRLAERPMSVERIRKLSLGMILEFDRSVEDPLELLINDRPIGCGKAVKTGDYFGLRVQSIADSSTRVRAMGR